MPVATLDHETETMDSTLLTELQRQDAALAELPDDFEFPLFDGRQTVESQRKSAYKNTPRAAREIIDNAGAPDTTLVEMKGAPHFLEGHRPEALAVVADWLGKRFP